ncbi:MAG: DUF4189 domain-containing protein [Fimbriiglobus sp.]
MFGAIARSEATGHFGRSWGHPTRAEAESAAVADCGHADGIVLLSGKDGWLALVLSPSTLAYGTGYGDGPHSACTGAMESGSRFAADAKVAVCFHTTDGRLAAESDHGVMNTEQAGRYCLISGLVMICANHGTFLAWNVVYLKILVVGCFVFTLGVATLIAPRTFSVYRREQDSTVGIASIFAVFGVGFGLAYVIATKVYGIELF